MYYPRTDRAYLGQWLQNSWDGIGIEFNFKAGTCRMAEWKEGKMINWLTNIQK
jgi:hypothetical protein